MAENEYYDFERALKKLSLEEEDLKRLISAGEIRAFREGSKIRLRAADVERVAKDLGVGGAAGKEADAGEVLEVEEVLFSESAKPADQGMTTTQLSEQDTLLDEEVEVVEMEEESAAAAPRPAARAARTAVPEKEDRTFLAVNIATLLVLVYGLAFLFAMSASRSNAITEPMVKMFR